MININVCDVGSYDGKNEMERIPRNLYIKRRYQDHETLWNEPINIQHTELYKVIYQTFTETFTNIQIFKLQFRNKLIRMLT